MSDESEISKSRVELLYAKILGLTSPNSPRDTLVIPTGNGLCVASCTHQSASTPPASPSPIFQPTCQ